MPKNLIYYFSGTGNSLSVARTLAEILGDALIIPLLSAEGEGVIPSDVHTVGLIYPIYMNALPSIVKTFISRIKVEKGYYIYAVATHGGIPGKAGCSLHKGLKDQNIELKGYFEVEMINNTPKGVAPKFLMKLEWEKDIIGDKVSSKIQQSNEQIQRIGNSIQLREAGLLEQVLEKEQGIGYWLTKQVWKLSEHSKPKLDFLLAEDCVGCGICEKVCTSKRIQMVDGKPNWVVADCHYCYACFNFCAPQAIGVKHYTKKLGRYHHPSIVWEDIAAQHE